MEGSTLPDSFFPSKHLSSDTLRSLEKVYDSPALSNSTEVSQSWGGATLPYLLMSHFPPQVIDWMINEKRCAWERPFWGQADMDAGRAITKPSLGFLSDVTIGPSSG